MGTVKLKEEFEVESKFGAFYTGGNVEWHENYLLCQTATAISKVDIETGTVIERFGEDNSEDADLIHAFTSDGKRVVTAHRSGLLKLWNSARELEKQWKFIHKGPIASLVLQNEKLVSGGSDGLVRVWDIAHHACTRALRGCQGVISVTKMHPTKEMIFASGDDGRVVAWEDNNNEQFLTYNGHFSKVTDIAFNYNETNFITSGRDKVLILWEIGNTAALKTIPVYEGVESLISLPQKFTLPSGKVKEGIHVAIAGELGKIRVWNMELAKEIFVQANSLVSRATEEGGLAISKLIKDKECNEIGMITVEHNIIVHHLKSFAIFKQFVGFSDDILDILFLGVNDAYLAVATNSSDIKLYENATMHCRLLKGHTDIVLALNKAEFNPNLLISSSKDNSIRLWLIDGGLCKCVGIGVRHTGSVGCVAFGNLKKFAVSASQDTCIKIWDVPNEDLSENANLYCRKTEVAHAKDINSVCVSPNDQLIASCSQDKTVKLWSVDLALLGVLKGHRRGVWCARFSPVDQVLLTSSADCSIRLWSLTELSCLKTIESHEASVVKCEFLTRGLQILSVGADGLVKLFNLKTSECIRTFDEHESRIWALAVNKEESQFVTGGSDSILIKWKDVTAEKRLEKLENQEKVALEEQQLSNFMQNDDLLKALKLALRLDKPRHVLRIVEGVIRKGDAGLIDAVRELRDDQKEQLFKYAADWNTNSRNCQAAQLVFNVLINEIQEGDFKPVGLGSIIEGALPYTERHFKRVTQMMQDLHFMNYIINCMQPNAKVN